MSLPWTHRLESQSNGFLHGFLFHIRNLNLQQNFIRGNVGVIGCGGGFPERTLICHPKGGFTIVKDHLTVFACDSDYYSYPETIFSSPVFRFNRSIRPVRGTVYFSRESSYEFYSNPALPQLDTVLMFRAVDTGRQIANLGLLKSIFPRVKSKGLAILTGGRFPEEFDDSLFSPFEMYRKVKLSNYSDGYPFTNNWGVILRKQ